jgi:hypothetical protein
VGVRIAILDTLLRAVLAENEDKTLAFLSSFNDNAALMESNPRLMS